MIPWERTKNGAAFFLSLLGCWFFVSCSSMDTDPVIIPASTIIPATQISTKITPVTPAASVVPTQLPTITPVRTNTPEQIMNPTEDLTFDLLPTTTAVATDTPILREEDNYRVAFVTSDDVLNIRSGPGIENQILSSLAPDAVGLTITGPGRPVSGSTWVPIQTAETVGWVNSRYLTGQVPSTLFCQDPAVTDLLTQLKTAIANEDSLLLAHTVHPERGLRLRTSWWNPEIMISSNELGDLFESPTSYDWGIEDGSGLPITGSFREVILPLLQNDLLAAANGSCNQIDHGPTAGSVQLPDGYQGINYSAFHRVAGDTIGFDWGTWVVGIEKWQSNYYLSFLIHYSYEI